MKSSLRSILSMGLIFSLASCSYTEKLNSTFINQSDISVSSKLSNTKDGIINISKFSFNQKNSGFKTKLVSFDQSVKKIELKVIGQNIETVSSGLKDFNSNSSNSLNVSVKSGKNRVLIVQGTDIDGNVLVELMGALDVEPHKVNTGNVGYFDTVIGSIIKNLIEMNSIYLSSLSLSDLTTSMINLTGFNRETNSFKNLDPSKLNAVTIAKTIETNKSVNITNTISDLSKNVPVSITTNQENAKVYITDLSTSNTVTTDGTFKAIFNNVAIGKYKAVVSKSGFKTVVKDMDTSGIEPFNYTVNLTPLTTTNPNPSSIDGTVGG